MVLNVDMECLEDLKIISQILAHMFVFMFFSYACFKYEKENLYQCKSTINVQR